MPVRGDRTCPVFNEADPRSLSRYFADLEALFRKHSVPDDAAAQADRKNFAVRYLSWAIEASWSSLDEFTEQTKTYDDFKKAVFELYPGVSTVPEWTVEDLQSVVDKRATAGVVKDLNEYSRFYVELRPIVKYLLGKNRINNIEANRALARALGASHRAAVGDRLKNDVPSRAANTPYTFEQFHKAATYVLQHRNDDFDDIWETTGPIGSIGGIGGSETPAPVHASSTIPPAPRVKQEDASAFATLVSKSVVSSLSAILPRAAMNPPPPDRAATRTPPPNAGGQRRDLPPRPPTPRRGCYYCGADGCETRRCPEATEDINARKIKRENGMLVMYDGNPIPYHLGQGTLREKVNFYLDAKRAEQSGADHMLLELCFPDEQDYVLVDDSSSPSLSESEIGRAHV